MFLLCVDHVPKLICFLYRFRVSGFGTCVDHVPKLICFLYRFRVSVLVSIEKKLSIVDCLIMSDRNTLMIPGCSSTCITGNNDIGNSDSDNDIAGIESNDEEVSAIADTGAVAIAGRVAVATRVNNQVNSVATRVNKEISFMTQHEFDTCPRAGQNRGENTQVQMFLSVAMETGPGFRTPVTGNKIHRHKENS